MVTILVEVLVGLISVAVVAGGACLTRNVRASSDIVAAVVDRYASRQGGWIANDVWGRSASAVRWYGAGIAFVGVFGLGIAVGFGIVVMLACLGLVASLVGATVAGFRYNVRSRLLAPPRIWEIIGWGLVLFVMFVVGATAEALINRASS